MSQLLDARSALWRARLLGGCSALCLTLWMGHPTLAQERRASKSAESFYEQFHVSLEGGWLINQSQANFEFADSLASAGALQPGRNGSMWGIELGGPFNPLYDWRAKWQSSVLKTSTGVATSDSPPTAALAKDSLRFHTFDAEFGYRAAGTALRLFAGARVLRAANSINYAYNEVDKFGSTAGDGVHKATFLGIGPRAGFDLTVPFPQQRAFASLNGSVSAILGRRDHTFIGAETSSPLVGTPTTTVTAIDYSRQLTIYNAEATAMLGYRLTDRATVELGYRAQYWTGMVPMISQVSVGSGSGVLTGDRNVLTHGPVAKLTIGWN